VTAVFAGVIRISCSARNSCQTWSRSRWNQWHLMRRVWG